MEEVEAKLEAEESKQRGHWRRTLQRFCTPVFLEALILTFLAGQHKLAYCKPASHPPAAVQASIALACCSVSPPAAVQASIAPPAGLDWCSQRSSPGQIIYCSARLGICAHAPWICVQQPVSAPVPVDTPMYCQSVTQLIYCWHAEWGDRSQIATITLAATFNPIGVTIGAVLGHCICTGTAVLGGDILCRRKLLPLCELLLME